MSIGLCLASYSPAGWNSSIGLSDGSLLTTCELPGPERTGCEK